MISNLRTGRTEQSKVSALQTAARRAQTEYKHLAVNCRCSTGEFINFFSEDDSKGAFFKLQEGASGTR
jgi:hypothetical protein